jgi:hypothetical protein
VNITNLSKSTYKTIILWNVAAMAVWAIALIILVARPLLLWQRGTSFDTYNLAGSRWLRGEGVYTHWMGFVYSPFVAAFFAPFSFLPTAIANIIWRLINAAILLGGLAAILKVNLFTGIKRDRIGIAYLLLVPLVIGNIDISQANPLVAGLIMLAVAAAYTERWNWAAFCIAIATLFKIYPLAAGLLICVIAPRRFAWRLFGILIVLTLLPFLFQHWSYVLEQYRAWISTRTADDRQNWPAEKVPLDLWFLIHWVLHLPVPPKVYTLIQLGSAAALAFFCALTTWKKWLPARILAGLFCLSAIWMTLCGPATESYTYMLLAAPSILAFLESAHSGPPFRIRIWVLASLALQFLAVARASFMPHFKPFWILATLPISALLFLIYCMFWLFNNAFWPETGGLVPKGQQDSAQGFQPWENAQ